MISDLLLVFGVAVLSAGLRTYQNPILFRLGTLGVVATSFLAGWLLGQSLVMGVVLAASWLFLPWLEILTRVRRMRLPMERALAPASPPSRGTFPNFSAVTSEVEDEGFEHLQDVGWEHDGHRHFYRVFNDPARSMQASISLSEQADLAFFYLSITSRTKDGRVYTTWNYPFSYGLKLEPHLKIQRFSGHGPFTKMLEAHAAFLKAEKVEPSELTLQDPEALVANMEGDMRAQISHNLDIGLLQRDGEKLIRYTVRGMFYLWFQFLRDFVRIS
jgi:hypothetical protein